MSKAWSATIRFNLAFSASSFFSFELAKALRLVYVHAAEPGALWAAFHLIEGILAGCPLGRTMLATNLGRCYATFLLFEDADYLLLTEPLLHLRISCNLKILVLFWPTSRGPRQIVNPLLILFCLS